VSDPSLAALRVDGMSKSFRRPAEQTHTLKERALHPFRRGGEVRFDALRDVSFEVAPGEFFGVVGRNGSGKSTLLKCLAGIYRADGGEAWLRGRLSAFIELGVGFNMDLPARDNIRLNGVMLGLTAAEVRDREDAVIEFAGLEGFEDLKIKNYSSGMLVRLGFSIMMHVDADVLLIDEVLAVGDAEFQQKCFDEFERIRSEGRTVLLVTHDMGAVQRYCDRALLLDHGLVRTVGPPERVAQEYLDLNMAERQIGPAKRGSVDVALRRTDPDRAGDGSAEIVDAWFETEDGRPAASVPHNRGAWFNFLVRFHEDTQNPIFGLTIGDVQHPTLVAVSTATHNEWTGTFTAGQEILARMHFHCVLEAGQYQVSPVVVQHGPAGGYLDRREGLLPLVVTNPQPSIGLVVPPHGFELRVVNEDSTQQRVAP
jgi:ABC-type polysaccharide/polyol phosphate transport system ATPase subunit